MRTPLSVPIRNYYGQKNQQNSTEVVLLFHANVFKAIACLKHSNFLKVTRSGSDYPRRKSTERTGLLHSTRGRPKALQARISRDSTTSFLTATTLIYALGAGITAAAGTRLALQLILVQRFKLHSFN